MLDNPLRNRLPFARCPKKTAGGGSPNGAAKSRIALALRFFFVLSHLQGRPDGGSRKARRCSIGLPTSVSVATRLEAGGGYNRHWSAIMAPELSAFNERDRRTLARAFRILEKAWHRPDSIKFDGPGAARDYFKYRLATLEREEFHACWLSANNRLIAAEVLFTGTLTQTSVYPRELVKSAIRHNAAAVIVAHNHPSGNPAPSKADLQLTQTLKQTLALVDVSLFDHIIIGGTGSVSLAEAGLL